MDTTNPRWLTAKRRRAHSTTVWTIIVSAVSAAALSVAVTASVLDTGERGRTTSATDASRMNLVLAKPREASTLTLTGADAVGGEPSATPPAAPAPVATAASPAVTAAAAPEQPVPEDPSAVATPAAAAPVVIVYAPITVPSNVAPAPAPVPAPEAAAPTAAAPPPPEEQTTAREAAPDAEPDVGSNPEGPSMSAGDGPFMTEAPPWTSSAWTSDPNAGAGPFETDRNTPGYGDYVWGGARAMHPLREGDRHERSR